MGTQYFMWVSSDCGEDLKPCRVGPWDVSFSWMSLTTPSSKAGEIGVGGLAWSF